MNEIGAGWYSDPADGSQLRYWSGWQWTEYVYRDGNTFTRPLPEGPVEVATTATPTRPARPAAVRPLLAIIIVLALIGLAKIGDLQQPTNLSGAQSTAASTSRTKIKKAKPKAQHKTTAAPAAKAKPSAPDSSASAIDQTAPPAAEAPAAATPPPPPPVVHVPPALTLTCPAPVTLGTATANLTFGYRLAEGDSPAARWTIDYGDGTNAATPSAAQAVSHTYRSPGSWTVTATVADGNGLTSSSTCRTSWTKPAPAPAPTPAAATPAPAPSATPAPASGLSNNNTYVNSDGNTVHSPAFTPNGQPPAGATAQCRDGSWSFSQHHSGTCSGHGGVDHWVP